MSFQAITDFLHVWDPMFSDYLLAISSTNFDRWELVGDLINQSEVIPSAVHNEEVMKHLYLYLNNYQLAKTYSGFSLQRWIQYDAENRLYDFDVQQVGKCRYVVDEGRVWINYVRKSDMIAYITETCSAVVLQAMLSWYRKSGEDLTDLVANARVVGREDLVAKIEETI